MTTTEPELLDVAQVAAYLHVSVRQVYRLRESGELPHLRVGRRILFEREQLVQFVESARQDPDVAADRCAAKIRELMSVAPTLTTTQRRELAALLVQEATA